MSNKVVRPPLPGILRQHGQTVGSVQLPADDERFIAEFNRTYAKLGLRVERLQAPQVNVPHPARAVA